MPYKFNLMNKIDLQQLIEIYNLDKKEIAETLFPGAKYPTLALNRIISGEALLDSDQVSKLALFIGVPIEKLYSGTKWAGKHNGNTHTFTNGEYKAELNTETWTTKLFHNDSLFHEEILHSGSTPLSEYLSKLDELILKHR